MAAARILSLLLVFGTAGAIGIGLTSTNLAGGWKPSIANARIPNPPAVPCHQQYWYNSDRACLSWTQPVAVKTASVDWDRKGAVVRTR